MKKEEYLLAIIAACSKGIITEATQNNLIDYYNKLDGRGLPVIFNFRHLRKILKIRKFEQSRYFGNERNKNYQVFFIPKSSGKWRKIEAPCDRLKLIQDWIKIEILDKIEVSKYAKGFVKECSILHNAVEHVNQELVINVDIKDFFPSISYSQVYKVFFYAGYTKQVSYLLAKLCTNNSDVLPQGAPTSPALSNIVCYKLDRRMSSLADKESGKYSRYADDITFSGRKTLRTILPLIKRIIEEEGYAVNENKVRLQYRNGRQSVTGLTVNNKVTVNKKLVKELENAIFYINKFGVSDHMEHINCNRAFYKEHLYGIAYFINMIDKQKGQMYLQRLSGLNWSY